MKKFRNFYLSFLAVASLGLMTSCGDDNDDPTPAPVPAPKEMNTFTAKILGNQQSNQAGSFFSSTDGSIKNSVDAKANPATIDFLYYYSVGGLAAADSATIAAPADVNAQEVFNASTTANIPSWATKNFTTFKYLGNGAATYNNVTTGDDVVNTFTGSTVAGATYVRKLRVNDVFAFKTDADKHGLAKVTNITMPTTANGNQSVITLDVKVEK